MEEFCGRRYFDERSLDERQIPDTPGTKITIQEPYRHLGHGAGVDEVGEAPLRRGHRRPNVIVENSEKIDFTANICIQNMKKNTNVGATGRSSHDRSV